MEILPIIVPFAYLVLIESITVRWIAGNPVPNLVSRILATNLAGVVLLILVSMTGWFFGWWPDIRNWALRDSFFLFLIVKAPVFIFLFRRWGAQKVFTLHVLSNYASAIALSVLFIYSPIVIGIRPVTAEQLNKAAEDNLLEINDAILAYQHTHGFYPEYLWGGDPLSWEINGRPSPDPLLNEGYLPAYPVNPLNLAKTYFEPRRKYGLKALWFGEKNTEFLHVRNLWQNIVITDPRFGYRGTKMGNVIPDPGVFNSFLPNDIRFAIQTFWLPGGFFYRSYDLDNNGNADAYILGVCGIEMSQGTMDCYDARTDTLTTNILGITVAAARDGIRDGVTYFRKIGFDNPALVTAETTESGDNPNTSNPLPFTTGTPLNVRPVEDSTTSAGLNENIPPDNDLDPDILPDDIVESE
jgi:hypothetical protein